MGVVVSMCQPLLPGLRTPLPWGHSTPQSHALGGEYVGSLGPFPPWAPHSF